MNRIRAWLGSSLLVFFAIIFTLGTLTSAFGFDVDIPVRFLVPGIASLILTGLATLLRGKGLAAGALPITLFVITKWTDIAAGAKWVLFFVSYEYNKWLPIPTFDGPKATEQELSLFFAAAGLVLSLLVTASVCLKRSTILTVVVTLPFILPALMLIEYVPSNVYLVGLLAVYLCLVFANALNPNDFLKQGKAVYQTLALVILILFAAYLIAPQDDFSRDMRVVSFDRWLRARFTDTSGTLPGLGWPELSGEWRFNTDYVAVADAGARKITNTPLLEINATQAGTFYLRGYSMLYFDGRSWQINVDDTVIARAGDLLPGFRSDIDPDTLVAILNVDDTELSKFDMNTVLIEKQYLPAVQQTAVIRGYIQQFPNAALNLANINIAKIEDNTEVSYYPYYSETSSNTEPNEASFYHLKDSILSLAAELPPGGYENRLPDYNEIAMGIYTFDSFIYSGVPVSELREIARQAGISPDADRAEIVDAVARYISRTASYSLSPPVTPAEEDFTLYFLQTSRRGYCIHFATAATLMLRSLGVPARFTSGFIATVSEGNVGESVIVTDRTAHAWVEVYYDDIGWVPLEVTPPSTSSGIPSWQSHSASPFGAGNLTPSGGMDTHEPTDEKDSGKHSTTPTSGAILLYIVISIATLIAALLIRRYFIDKIRTKAFNQDDTNAAVIRAWRYITRLSPGEMPDEYYELALKARFSQHRITEDERAAVTGYATKLAAEKYKNKRLLRRIWMRYIRGL